MSAARRAGGADTWNEVSGHVQGPVVQVGGTVTGNVVVHPPPAPGLTAPAQLPAPAHFVDRTQPLAVLDALASEASDSGLRILLCGPGGVGKTSLATTWLHRLRDRYRDGQLYADLRGYTIGADPASPQAALGWLLRGLGVGPEYLPGSLAEAAGLWRSLTAGRRLLVLLDNARSDTQIRPLLLGSSPAITVITSRAPLGGLVAAGAHLMRLEPLAEADAVELFARICGPRAGHRLWAAAARGHGRRSPGGDPPPPVARLPERADQHPCPDHLD